MYKAICVQCSFQFRGKTKEDLDSKFFPHEKETGHKRYKWDQIIE